MTSTLDASVRELALRLYEGADTPVSLSCAIRLRYDEFDQIARASVDPRSYASHAAFVLDEVSVSFLRKYGPLPSKIDKAKEALKAFTQSEEECYAANQRIVHLRDGYLSLADCAVVDALNRAKAFCSRVLGRLPDDLNPRFGPGTAVGLSQYTTVCDKLSSVPTYYGYFPLLQSMFPPTWERAIGYRRPSEVPGNRFTTVPKDAKTDRGICIEAGLNVYVQLGIGAEIRSRLRRKAGIDLTTGQDLHRLLAQMASVDSSLHSLATIDLSRASDTLCTELVRWLIPEPWFELLDSVRAKRTLVEGKWVRLNKFSSMGNGFTFELETLVFLALMQAAAPDERVGSSLFAYGDDLLCPITAAPAVVGLLRWAGFTPNPRKTFTDGPFRESCGGDFFDGVPVRAYYLKDEPREPSDWISIVNGIRALSERTSSYGRPDHWLLDAWNWARSNLPSRVRRLRGPAALGDLVIHDPDPRSWFTRHTHSIRYVRGLRPTSKRVPLSYWSSNVQMAAALYGVASQGPSPRDSITGYKEVWLAYS